MIPKIFQNFKKDISGTLKASIIPLIIFSIILIILSPPWKNLGWDEVDFFNASIKGLKDNYLDGSSLGLLYSFKLLLYKFGLSGNNLIPLNYQESEDVFLLRHFHPPLMQYLTIYFYFIKNFDPKLIEIGVFFARYIFGIILVITFYFFNKKIYGNKIKIRSNFLSFGISIYGALILSQYLQYHILIAISLILICFSLTKLLNDRNKKNYILNSVALTISILSLETSLIIIFASIILFLIFSLNDGLNFKEILKKILLYFVIVPYSLVFILWPGSFINASVLKTYSMYLYRIVISKNEYSNVFNLETLKTTFLPLTPLILCFISALFLIIYYLKSQSKFNSINFKGIIVSSTLGISYTLFIIPFSLNSTYLVPGVLVFIMPISNILEIINFRGIKIFKLLIIVIFISFLPLLPGLLKNNLMQKYPDRNTIKSIEKFLENKNEFDLYADGGHIYKFYYPNFSNKIESLTINENDKFEKKLFLRSKNEYKEIIISDIDRPSLFVVRKDYEDVFENYKHKCVSLKSTQINAKTCILE